MEHIDRLIEQQLKTQPIVEPIAPPPARIDRTIQLTQEQELELLQLETEYQRDWIETRGNRAAQRSARDRYLKNRRALRLQAIAPYARQDLSGLSLVYGPLPLLPDTPTPIALDQPNGTHWKVTTLIHFTHPVSPEDLYLRECRVQAERIIRYRVPGLDGGEWMTQDEPRDRLDAIMWRHLLKERLTYA